MAMSVEDVKAALEAIESGDDAKAMDLLKQLLAKAAGDGSDGDDESDAKEEVESADHPKVVESRHALRAAMNRGDVHGANGVLAILRSMPVVRAAAPAKRPAAGLSPLQRKLAAEHGFTDAEARRVFLGK